MTIKIDYSRDKLFDEFGIMTLEDRYMVADETSPQQAFARAAKVFSDDDDHAQRLYDYVSNHWFMFATPLLSNGGTERGLPISCFLNYVDDSREGITEHYTENAYLSSFGGGIGGSWSEVRAQGTRTSKGSESTGVIPFMKVVDAEMIDDGNLITLERKFSFYDGFQIRLRRIIIEEKNIINSEILLESLPWEYYNFEGLSKWKDNDGQIYLTLISDNQFSPLLETEVREFILKK